MIGRMLLVLVFYSIVTCNVASHADSPVLTCATTGTDYQPHERIEIIRDDDFTAENGVRSGNGTALDPYIIEGWEIDASGGPGIAVQNTDARFVIRNVWVHSASVPTDGSAAYAIMMYNVRLAEVRDSVLSNNSGGVHIWFCSTVSIAGCLIADNRGSGISTNSCEFIRVWDCDIMRNQWGGVEFGSAENCHLADSTVTGGEHWVAVNLYMAHHSSVRNCNVTDCTAVGVNIGFSEDCNVSGNLIQGNGIGACVYGSERITMTSNVFLDNDEDIRNDDEPDDSFMPVAVMIAIVITVGVAALYINRRSRLKGFQK